MDFNIQQISVALQMKTGNGIGYPTQCILKDGRFQKYRLSADFRAPLRETAEGPTFKKDLLGYWGWIRGVFYGGVRT